MTTATHDKFQIGDRVLHPAKPEWGAGTVASAAGAVHEGAPCQRLSIRFDRAGLKTISTAFVNLRRAAGAATAFPEPKPEPRPDTAPANARGVRPSGVFAASAGPDPLAPPAPNGMPTDPREARRLMTAVPDDVVDPFQSPAARLRATLGLYRFKPTGGSLIDWAAAQSGLADPLSHFARHELEEYFSDFRRNLDKALAKAVADASKVDPAELRSIAQSAPPDAQRALQTIHRRR